MTPSNYYEKRGDELLAQRAAKEAEFSYRHAQSELSPIPSDSYLEAWKRLEGKIHEAIYRQFTGNPEA